MSKAGESTIRALLFTDIQGSTELWEQDPHALAASLTEHDRIVRTVIEAKRGTVFTTAGDSFAAAFTAASEAVESAKAIQGALLDHEWDARAPIAVRIGIHLGEVLHRDDDYFGSSVNRAARVCDAGHGGQVVVTDEIVSLCPTQSFRPLGTHRLKGVEDPIALHQLLGEGLRSDFAPIRANTRYQAALPTWRTSLVGREDETEEILAMLQRHRSVTLTGGGGVGKTRLATAVAELASSLYPAGVVFVDLAPVVSDAEVGLTIASRLHVVDSSSIGVDLEDERLLIVLDNCEQVVDAVADVVEEIIDATSLVTVVATSREPLDVDGERVMRVRGLAPGHALALFEERADQTVVQSPHDRAIAAQICSRLDHIPLAIELAAARTRTLTVEGVAERLDDRFRLLTGGRRRTRGRQQTLETTIAWSYDLLDPDDAAALASLSVFAGQFPLDAAAAVVGVDEMVCLDLLDSLVAKSLVESSHHDDHGEMLYSLLETIRVYANDRLVESGRADEARGRLCDYLIVEIPMFSERWRHHLHAPDVYSAAEWVEQSEDERRSRSIRAVLGDVMHVDGQVARAQTILLDALGDTIEPETRSTILLDLANGAAYLGDPLAGRRFLDEGVALAPTQESSVYALFLYSNITAGIDPAQGLADLAIVEAAAEQHPELAGFAYGVRGVHAQWAEDYERAAELAFAALRVIDSDAPWARCQLTQHILTSFARSDDPGRALDWLDREPLALTLPRFYRTTNSGWMYRIDLHALVAVAAVAAGDRSRAHAHLGEAVALVDQRSPNPNRSQMALVLGLISMCLDDEDHARARTLCQALDTPSGGMVVPGVHLIADAEGVADAERAAFIRSEPIRRVLETDDAGRFERARMTEESIAHFGLRS